MALAQGVVLGSILYDVSGTDPITYAGVTALVIAASLLAS